MRKDRFTDEALANARALSNVKSQDAESFAEAYDFARCQRPDGSFYPIPDGKQCRKGTKASPIDPGAKRQRQGQKPVVEASAKRTKAKIDREIASVIQQSKGAKGTKANQLRQRLTALKAERRESGKVKVANEPPKKPKTDFRKEVEAGAKKRKERDAGMEQRQKEEARLKRALTQVLAKERNARRDGDDVAARKFMQASIKINKRLDEVQGARLTGAAPKRESPAKKKESSSGGKGTPEQRMQLERLRDRLDDAVTVKEQQRIGSAISALQKRMG